MTIEIDKPEPIVIADDSALDFVNTKCAPSGEVIDWIQNGEELVAWLYRVKLIGADDINSINSKFADKELDAVAKKARQLREIFRSVLTGNAFDQEIDVDCVNRLNELASKLTIYQQLVFNDQNEWVLERKIHWSNAEVILAIIAERIIHLFSLNAKHLIKQCSGENCTLWYRDITKNKRRKWCSMAICGNRAKAAAHRSRLREH